MIAAHSEGARQQNANEANEKKIGYDKLIRKVFVYDGVHYKIWLKIIINLPVCMLLLPADKLVR